jgi:uncharacterized protein YyaL (SSP411 family)
VDFRAEGLKYTASLDALYLRHAQHHAIAAQAADVAPALVVLIVPEGCDASAMRSALRDVSLPNAVIQEVREGDAVPDSSPAHGKTAVDGRVTAYVCLGPQCSLPVREADALVETIKAAREVAVA